MKRVLNMFSALLNVRNFFVLFTAVLLLTPLSLVWLKQPNQLLFGFGAYFAPKPKPDPDQPIVKILVTQSEMDRFVKDMPGAVDLGAVLQGLRGVFTKGILLVVDEPPYTGQYAADIVVGQMVKDNALRESLQASGILSTIEALGQRRDNYNSQIKDGSLLLGIAQSSLVKEKINYLRDSTAVPLTKQNETLLTRIMVFFKPSDFLLTKFRYESENSGFPVYIDQNSELAYPLLWRAGDRYFPDAVLALLKKTHGVNQVRQNGKNLVLDDKLFPLSDGNIIYPIYSSRTVQANIKEYSLADLKNPGSYAQFNYKTVLIGVKDNRQFADIAAAYYSLDKRAYYTTPDWYFWAEKAGLLFMLLYLFLLVPRLRINHGLMSTAFFAAALLVLQYFLQWTRMQWLPIGLLLGYLLIGHVFALLWMLQKNIFSPSLTSNTRTGKRHSVILKQKQREEPRLPAAKPDSIFTRTLAINKPKKLTLGRYQIDSELGRGAMGVVYLGHDPNISRQVAIKTLSYLQFPGEDLPELKARFFREAKAAGKLSHPNIVTIYDQGEEENLAYIAMEYVNGKPLSSYIQKNKLLNNWDEIYWIIECVADAINYAHKEKIIHRDIKPSNILYNPEQQKVKVADFGIARFENSSSTRTGEILGSPLYMSPEQVKGEPVTGKTDIYSLGVTFYQLLTGQLPFTGDSLPAITHQIVQGKYIPVTELNPKIPESAHRIIARAMHKDPEKRYATAEDMMNDIAKYRAKGL
jgi:predicted Ser/Thr protein kinase